ncbi:hypothetical protein LEN26_003510 [Aphanomyces euteiches]|nr:hypothetical protein AeMF1_010567 [Aphanomyces euteiches]KAH9145814.1 hypothetical protein LEN26_004977 [Aphanomyces euteiches]KAH9153657.1 hypothetical protein LEN26_003510 [Aphanomyces euteiches]
MGQRQGIVVSIIGTGVLYTHKALKGDWGSDYGWYDPNGKKTAPYDGCPDTHTMGAFAGQNGCSSERKWIACCGCTTDSSPEALLTACSQWILCPSQLCHVSECREQLVRWLDGRLLVVSIECGCVAQGWDYSSLCQK